MHGESLAPGRFQHTRWSRIRFVQRWRGQLEADDTAHHAADGMVIDGWKEDQDDFRAMGIGPDRARGYRLPNDFKCAITVHVFYLELWPGISQHLSLLHLDYDLHITCCPELISTVGAMIRADFPSAEIHCFPNEGMDVLPFLKQLPILKKLGYSLVCKLHTKRGVEPLGPVWRRNLLQSLIGNADNIQAILKSFIKHPALMMVGPSSLYVSAKLVMYKNRTTLERIHGILFPGFAMPDDWGFFAGSMFWSRIDALLPIASVAENHYHKGCEDLAEEENSDGSMAHAIERAFGWAAYNGQVALIEPWRNNTKADRAGKDKISIIWSIAAEKRLRYLHLSEILDKLD